MRDLIRQIEKDFPINDIEKISLGLIFYYYLSARQEEFYDKLQGITEPTYYGDEEFEKQTSSKRSKNSAYSQLTDAQAKEFEQQSVAELGYFIPPSLLLNQKSFDNGEFITRDSLEEIFQNFYDSITDENTKHLLDGVFTFVLTTLDQNYEYDSSLKNLIEQLVKQLPDILTQYKKFQYTFVDAFADEIIDSAHYYNRDRHQYRRSQGFDDFLAQLALANKESVESIYDMTCYSGELLNETVKQLGVQKVKRICGQEHDATMYDFCRMNLFAQQIPSEKLDIRYGNFVTSPAFGTEGSEQFDVILHNMPYEIPIDKNLNFDAQKTSRHSSQDAQVNKLRELIIPEALTHHSKTKLSRFVYIFHALKHLAEHGTAVILCSSNFLRTIKEDKEENPVFRYLLGITEGHNGYIDAIIQFNKENMAILVLKKNRPSSQIFFAADYENGYVDIKLADICLQRQDYAGDDYVTKVVDLETVRSEKSLLPYTYLPAPDIRENIDVERIQANIEQERKKQDNIRARIDEFLGRDNQA